MKNLAQYNSPESIGTNHWFRTLVGQLKRMGEFIKIHGCDIKHQVIIHTYGSLIFNITYDLLEWQETNTPLKNDEENYSSESWEDAWDSFKKTDTYKNTNAANIMPSYTHFLKENYILKKKE